MGTDATPSPVDTSTRVAAVSADQRFSAALARSTRAHDGGKKELMMDDGPAPRGASQCEMTA